MNRALIAFAAIVVSVLAGGPHPDAGPAGMLEGAQCTEVGEKHVDSKNMCWYHECILDEEYGGLRAIGRRCALGSKLSYNFIHGFYNPCTINFDSTFGYECVREKASVDGPPACFNDLECYNGGSKTYEADKCWCVCPMTWQGDWDCSKPTRDVSDLPPLSDICVGGEPLDDWCALAGGCEDGGTCYNQCDTFWCDCPNHLDYNYLGKRCETMDMGASTDNANQQPDYEPKVDGGNQGQPDYEPKVDGGNQGQPDYEPKVDGGNQGQPDYKSEVDGANQEQPDYTTTTTTTTPAYSGTEEAAEEVPEYKPDEAPGSQDPAY